MLLPMPQVSGAASVSHNDVQQLFVQTHMPAIVGAVQRGCCAGIALQMQQCVVGVLMGNKAMQIAPSAVVLSMWPLQAQLNSKSQVNKRE